MYTQSDPAPSPNPRTPPPPTHLKCCAASATTRAPSCPWDCACGLACCWRLGRRWARRERCATNSSTSTPVACGVGGCVVMGKDDKMNLGRPVTYCDVMMHVNDKMDGFI